MGLLCSAFGLETTVIFLVTVKEISLTKECNEAVKNIKLMMKQREGKKR